MVATFRETWASVRNLNYGQEIVKRTVGQAFWYWFKYVLLVAAVIVAAILSALTYFVPQIPRLAEKYLPDVNIAIKDGQLSTTAQQPLTFSGEGFTFTLNTEGQPKDLDRFDAGVLVLKDRLILKDQTQTRTIAFSQIEGEVKLDKLSLVGWLEANKLVLLGIGVAVVILTTLIGIGFYTAWQTVSFVIGAVALWAAARLLGRSLIFVNSLKLAVYAAVPALLVSSVFVLNPNQIGSVISLAVWAFFGLIWALK